MNTLEKLERTIDSRAKEDPGNSWTATLLQGGRAKCAQKFGEESIEAVIAGVGGNRQEIISETADALYHLLVMLKANDVTLTEVYQELELRMGKSGIKEKRAR